MNTTTAVVQLGTERAHIYPEGGCGFEKRLRCFDRTAWFVEEEPSPAIVGLALHVRRSVFPDLPDLTVEDVLG